MKIDEILHEFPSRGVEFIDCGGELIPDGGG